MADRFTMGGCEECGGHDGLGYVEVCERSATSLRSHWLNHRPCIYLERRDVRKGGEPRIYAMRKGVFGFGVCDGDGEHGGDMGTGRLPVPEAQ